MTDRPRLTPDLLQHIMQDCLYVGPTASNARWLEQEILLCWDEIAQWRATMARLSLRVIAMRATADHAFTEGEET